MRSTEINHNRSGKPDDNGNAKILFNEHGRDIFVPASVFILLYVSFTHAIDGAEK